MPPPTSSSERPCRLRRCRHELLRALSAGRAGALGDPRAAVDYVFLTHVHLDHAGGAGVLLQALPNARAVLHPRGAPHMIEPEKLIAGSKVVYGEERFARLYGELVPTPTARVYEVEDGEHSRSRWPRRWS